MADQTTRLIPNRDVALKVYNQQLKRLSTNPEDKVDIIKSEKKLQSLDFVDYVKDLPADVQASLKTNQLTYFIPWLAVWKEIFQHLAGSSLTRSGYSLNDILAKGHNNMNKLVDIFVR